MCVRAHMCKRRLLRSLLLLIPPLFKVPHSTLSGTFAIVRKESPGLFPTIVLVEKYLGPQGHSASVFLLGLPIASPAGPEFFPLKLSSPLTLNERCRFPETTENSRNQRDQQRLRGAPGHCGRVGVAWRAGAWPGGRGRARRWPRPPRGPADSAPGQEVTQKKKNKTPKNTQHNSSRCEERSQLGEKSGKARPDRSPPPFSRGWGWARARGKLGPRAPRGAGGSGHSGRPRRVGARGPRERRPRCRARSGSAAAGGCGRGSTRPPGPGRGAWRNLGGGRGRQGEGRG